MCAYFHNEGLCAALKASSGVTPIVIEVTLVSVGVSSLTAELPYYKTGVEDRRFVERAPTHTTTKMPSKPTQEWIALQECVPQVSHVEPEPPEKAHHVTTQHLRLIIERKTCKFVRSPKNGPNHHGHIDYDQLNPARSKDYRSWGAGKQGPAPLAKEHTESAAYEGRELLEQLLARPYLWGDHCKQSIAAMHQQRTAAPSITITAFPEP
eukprot:1024843-Amphidinium_carterae.1